MSVSAFFILECAQTRRVLHTSILVKTISSKMVVLKHE